MHGIVATYYPNHPQTANRSQFQPFHTLSTQRSTVQLDSYTQVQSADVERTLANLFGVCVIFLSIDFSSNPAIPMLRRVRLFVFETAGTTEFTLPNVGAFGSFLCVRVVNISKTNKLTTPFVR